MSENFKQDKLKNFTVIRNEIIEDKELSFKALGLAVFMLHLPADWKFSVAGLSSVTGKSESKIKTALQELEERGYLKRHQSLVGNKFGGMVYEISDKLKTENFSSAEKSLAKNPTATFSTAEKSPLLNTKEQNTNLSTTKESISTEFEKLWELYPKKQGKKAALKHYTKARESGTTYEEVEKGIRAYVRHIEATNKDIQYVKMGSSFFSQEAWKDEWETEDGKRMGQVHDRSDKRDSTRVAGTTDGSGRGTEAPKVTFPRVAYGFQEEA